VVPAIVPADGVPNGSGDPNYTVYGGCGTDLDTPPAHLCHKGDSVGAFFKSNAKDTLYEVCLQQRHFRRCAYAQSASQGVLYVNHLAGVGSPTVLRWRVGGGEIGSWQMDVFPDPVVPKFSLSPLIVARTHRLFGLVVRDVPPGLRIRAWRRCQSLCPLPLRLISVRGDVRRYEIAGSPSQATFALRQRLYVQVDAPGKSEHGYRVWGRLYQGELVRDRRGGPRDTAIEKIGDLRCTPPGSNFRGARHCAEVAKQAGEYPSR
jgi:hypothetical protein